MAKAVTCILSHAYFKSQELLFHDFSPLVVPYLILETARNPPSLAKQGKGTKRDTVFGRDHFKPLGFCSQKNNLEMHHTIPEQGLQCLLRMFFTKFVLYVFISSNTAIDFTPFY